MLSVCARTSAAESEREREIERESFRVLARSVLECCCSIKSETRFLTF
jgi:hypothetical protein